VGNLVRVFYTGRVGLAFAAGVTVGTFTITLIPNAQIALGTLMGAKVSLNFEQAGYRLLSAASAHNDVSKSAVITAHVTMAQPSADADLAFTLAYTTTAT
jgi:hypothetical protein